MQLYFSPVSYSKPTPGVRKLMSPDPFPGLLHRHLALPPEEPRRASEIRSRDPLEAPPIEPNYLSAPDDLRDMLDGVRLIRRIARQPAMRAVIEEEMQPGVGGRRARPIWSPTSGRAQAASSMRPAPAGWGRMRRASVVDHRLRVHGIGGLRVIDASVFPNVTSANTNAPTMMVAEKGAAMVLEDQTVR